MMMKLFLISQKQNNGCDTYDSAVVAARNALEASFTSPGNGTCITDWSGEYSWCDSVIHVTVEYLGEAAEGTSAGVICASFNAG
jgi:hypothetical protein